MASHYKNSLFAVLFFCLFFTLPAVADESNAYVQAQIEQNLSPVMPGDVTKVTVSFTIDEGWVIKASPPEETLAPTTFAWHLPEGFRILKEQWDKKQSSYAGTATYTATVATPTTWQGADAPLSVDVAWVACSDSCIPGQTTLETTLPFVPYDASSAISSTTFLLALLGGLILNFMPCVLPVASIKLLSLIRLREHKTRSAIVHGFLYAFGVIAMFLVFASLLFLFQAFGIHLGWGFHMQQPIVIALLSLLLVGLAFHLFGIYHLNFNLGRFVSVQPKSTETPLSIIATGALAVILSTPCIGPFLGSVMGLALALSPFHAFQVFSVIGLGMALPYILIALFPPLLRLLPKPGEWMVAFQQLMGFFLLSTVLWLLWVFAAQTSSDALIILLISLLTMAFAVWIYGRWKTASSRFFAFTVAIIAITIAAYSAFFPAQVRHASATNVAYEPSSQWLPYNAQHIETLLEEGTPVFVEYTAKWCLICQVNAPILHSEAVENAFRDKQVATFRADWTSHNPEITESLNSYGRSGVPLYVLLDPNGDVQILPQILTQNEILSTLDQLSHDE